MKNGTFQKKIHSDYCKAIINGKKNAQWILCDFPFPYPL
jgi:hypothetical protein